MVVGDTMGNSFHGRIYEFPDVVVDKFNADASVYLLTHCHSDHLAGLCNKSFQSKVYCSEVTKEMIALDSQYREVLPQIVTVPFDQPFDVVLESGVARITLIAAYHCPGSAMFLIESEEYNVLITGDIRAEKWWTDSLVKNHFLFPYTCGIKTLHNIYLDTTFGYRGEPYIEILPNSEGIAAVIKLLKLYPADEPDIDVWFRDTVLGFEEAWCHIVLEMRGSMAAKKTILRKHDILSKYSYVSPYTKHLGTLTQSTMGNDLQFYAGDVEIPKGKFTISIRQCINFNIIDYVNSLLPIPLDGLKPTEYDNIQLLDITSKGYKIVEFRGRQWIMVGKELLPKEIKLVFSRHSSYSECGSFVNLFKPVQVYPCVASDSLWKNGFVMSRLFGDVCISRSSGNFIFDVLNSTKMNFPSPEIMHRSVKTINRWNIYECEDELRFVEKFLQPTEDTPRPEEFNNKRVKREESDSIRLSKYISHRTDTEFQKLIKQGEFLYEQYIRHGMPGQRPTTRNYMHDFSQLEDQFFEDDRQSNVTSDDSECYARISLSFNEPEKGPRPSKLIGEYGTVVRIASITDKQNIMSSFDSVEVSVKPDPEKDLDDANIYRISRTLAGNPDKYFLYHLQSVNR